MFDAADRKKLIPKIALLLALDPKKTVIIRNISYNPTYRNRIKERVRNREKERNERKKEKKEKGTF